MDYHAIFQARIRLRNQPTGILKKLSAAQYSFQYDLDYLKLPHCIPIACAFPLRSEPFLSPVLHPFFDNLILEGWLLSHAEKIFHIDKKNRFALLMAIGRFPIGAISVIPLDSDENECLLQIDPESPPPMHLEKVEFPNKDGYCPACLWPSPKGRVLHPRCSTALFGTSRKLKVEIDTENPVETFSRTIYGGSISGAQRKGLFSLDPKGVLHSSPIDSEYILKPAGDYLELPANEHLTMAIAQEIGFPIPPFSLIKVPSLGYLFLIRRFDKTQLMSRRMEDMAQIIGKPSEDKYNSSNEKVAQSIRSHATSPPLDLGDFFKRLLFCFLIGNADMHLKNWSLLEKESLNGELDLSPCYDLLNTRLLIPREKIDIGLSILGKNRNLQRSYFYRFAVDVLQLEEKFIKKTFDDLDVWFNVIVTLVSRSYLTKNFQKKYLEIVAERLAVLKKLG